ncbi:Symplekin [Camellia lanceoleosa]|uniref:Symplekin n=1 Tax=Camellia lanceoleosa TaxID=1840588 RepID=A0ACC0G9S3_9ERIC|nr:Symplekin [Camellia lanceoleosa]
MVGIMATTSRENVARLMNSAKFAIDIPSKLEQLRQLKNDLSQADSVLLSEFLPSLLDLHSDQFSPVRKFVTKMIGDIGLKHVEFIPDIIPVLITVLKDGTPAVARQAITCGIDLFRSTLVKVAIQGLYSSELDNSLESSWAWVLKFRDEIYLIAFQLGSDGTRLLALKFVEVVILLYTPDPNGSSEPPPHQAFEGKFPEFNISWLRGGHPVLNVGDLSIEASQGLGLLLDQLRFPTVKSLSNSMIIVLINSLSAIARKRPAFYGRILPVLLGFDPSGFVNKGVCVSGVHHALKNAFLSCLKCTHPGAAPWQDRLAGALRDLKAGGLVQQALLQVCQINGSVEGKDDLPITLEEKPSIKGHDAVHGSARRKRPGVQDVGDSVEDDDVSGKRIRPTPIVSEGSEKDRDQDDIPSSGVTTSRDVDNGPVQQLVAMFGTLVAQGEKAIGPLEILISSISADLLAEVVMANMRHLPPNRPKAEGDEEPLPNMGSFPNIVSCDTQFKHLSSILAEMLSMSGTPMQMDSVSDAQRSSSNDIEDTRGEEDNDALSAGVNYGIEQGLVSLPVSSPDEVPSSMEDGFSALPPEVPDVGNLGSEIPGLDSAVQSVGLAETPIVSSLAPTDLEDASQEQGTSLGSSVMELVPSISTDRSEELSPKAAVTDVSSRNSLTVTSVGLSTQFILPKMSAPVINLADEEKDQLQKLAFTRIVEAYKQIADAGGSHVHFSLLAYLGVEFPLELDPWKILQKHILSDYMNHEGHELTLRVLYKLFGEAEERDFFSSSTATSVYEMFILTVAEALRDSFPASDKSLSRLLGEAPYLPKSIFNLLECLCSPGSSDKDEELPSGDRVTQGLSAVWSLILLRPPIRDVCLKIALQSAVHHLEEVRMKAIRLVANKLYPLSAIAQQIEEFAKEMLHSVSNGDDTMDRIDGDRTELQKDLDKPTTEQLSVGAVTKDISSDTSQSCVSPNFSSSSLMEAQRCMSLYFALCTKKHSLFREIFVVYKSTSNAVKQAVHRQIPILVRTIGSSSEFLEIISDPPTGSESLLMQVLHTLTDGIIPSPELILTIRKLYDTKVKDVEVLIPILSYLPKDEVLRIFPHLVNLPLDKFQAALARVLQGSSQSGPLILPAEVLIAIHGIDPDRDGIPLKKVTDACNACFEQRQIFTQQVLAKVLNQLVEQIPLPLLFMRTVLQAIGAFPALVEFIMEILSRLVNKQIWKYPKLWVGFLKCALLTKPQSFSVLLQLPPAQLENALNRTAALKAPLIVHASQPNIRSSLPRSVLVVLGIASETQNTSQVQTTPACPVDAGNSDKEAVTEKSKESSSAS